MNGTGRANAAVTVLNALPSGIGSAIGIDLSATVDVELQLPPRASPVLRIEPERSRTLLVRSALEIALATYSDGTAAPAVLRVRSQIPERKGLKSSSAVASAVALAVARALGKEPDPLDIARLSARIGRESGTSATGAFDDALAGLVDGLVVTDNRRDLVLERRPLLGPFEVGLWIPESSHPAAPSLLDALRREAPSAERAAQLARSGRWSEAMDENSELVERALGYSYGESRRRAREGGAVAAGVSGLGPAFAVIAPPGRLASIEDCYPTGPANRVRTTIGTPRGAVTGRGS